MTGDCDSLQHGFIKICLHKNANLHMTKKSQQRVPHVVFVIFIGMRRGEQGRAYLLPPLAPPPSPLSLPHHHHHHHHPQPHRTTTTSVAILAQDVIGVPGWRLGSVYLSALLSALTTKSLFAQRLSRCIDGFCQCRLEVAVRSSWARNSSFSGDKEFCGSH